MSRLTLVAALVAAFVGVAGAQAPVAEWLFDGDVTGWSAIDPASQVSSTADANVVREEGNGVLELSFTPAVGTISGVMGQVPAGLAGAQSLRMHLKSTGQTIIMVALVEGDGSSYNTGFTSLPDRWQEIALDLDELQLGDDSTDENGQLDPGQVQAIMVADMVAMLAALAEQVPFVVTPDLSPRMLWLDDMSVDTEGVDPRWIETDVAGQKAVQIDSFESAPLQWVTLGGKGIETAYDAEWKTDGEYSLRVTYDLPPMKVFLMMTGLRGVPLEGSTLLRFSYLSEVSTTLLIEIKELDESKYQTMAQVTAADEFATYELALDQMVLADDSTDENGKLDIAQAKELLLADVSAMGETPVTLNTLWLDDVRFVQ